MLSLSIILRIELKTGMVLGEGREAWVIDSAGILLMFAWMQWRYGSGLLGPEW